MNLFVQASLAGWLLVVTAGALFRSRTYAIFRAITLGLHTLITAALWPAFAWAAPVFIVLHSTVYLQALALIRPAMRPLPYRALISLPSAWFAAGTLLALPWALVRATGSEPPAPWFPYAIALFGLVQSLSARKQDVDVVVADGHAGDGVRRHPRGRERVERPLRIVQISDPHLGPFMSQRRLNRICVRALSRRPDLIVLTGDFLTMESQRDPSLLANALAPLAAAEGRVFACFGNHDHEAPDVVRAALNSARVRLLVDEAEMVDTPAGRVQIVGMDFHWRRRKQRVRDVCARFPRAAGALRLVLLHDPGAFRHLPAGEADLVLSGHTHGGQVGCVSLGLPFTMLRVLMNAPDHGFWASATNRLYVHRGTGHYGFPLRLGVPAEESLLRVHPLAPELGSDRSC